NCLTPNNETAQCISVFSCPVLLPAAQTQKEFYNKSLCGGEAGFPHVCCGTLGTYITQQEIIKAPTERKLSKYNQVCGYQHSDDHYHTINDTALTEFPWFAKIKLKPKNPSIVAKTIYSLGFACSGSLISLQYVITSASCISHRKYEPEIVRLGEYSLLNKTDCMEDSDVYECSSNVQDLGIDQVIPHPQYQELGFFFAINDIGLIRLNKSAEFTDYVRPICVPYPDVPKLTVNDTLITVKLPENYSNVKPRLARQYVQDDECRSYIQEMVKNIDNGGHMCGAAINATSKTCDGNNLGSSVTVSRRSRQGRKWYLVGIVSGRFANCILEDTNIYTKVSHYLDWINENLNL
ncbi:hypothetical protein ILUMI_09576, partial [Ignelater luminosus]